MGDAKDDGMPLPAAESVVEEQPGAKRQRQTGVEEASPENGASDDHPASDGAEGGESGASADAAGTSAAGGAGAGRGALERTDASS